MLRRRGRLGWGDDLRGGILRGRRGAHELRRLHRQQAGHGEDRDRQQPWRGEAQHHRAILSAFSRSRSAWLRTRGSVESASATTVRRGGALASGRPARTSASSRSARRSPRSISSVRSSFSDSAASTWRAICCPAPSAAVRSRSMPMLRLMRAGVEAGDQFLQFHAIAFQHAERALQAHGVKQGCRKEGDQHEFENPLHADHCGAGVLGNCE